MLHDDKYVHEKVVVCMLLELDCIEDSCTEETDRLQAACSIAMCV